MKNMYKLWAYVVRCLVLPVYLLFVGVPAGFRKAIEAWKADSGVLLGLEAPYVDSKDTAAEGEEDNE